MEQPTRPLAHYHPSLWGDRFLNYVPPQDEETQRKKQQEVNELKEQVRKMLLGVVDDTKERLVLIDALEQLGVAYHFEEEIESNLQQFYNYYSHDNDCYEHDLHYVSLRFRLLRQHGFYALPDVFEKFKSKNGSFKEDLTTDVVGILNLYEAAYLRVHGEKILDEALEFTTTQLKSVVGQLSHPLATQVTQALNLPLHKGVPRLMSRYNISTYEANPSHDQTLLKFAKLDFNLLQSLHLKELRDISWWWKMLDFGTKLPFARDRVVELYFWILGAFYEPKYALGRDICTKLIKLVSVIDDIYDAYGLFDELQVYTEAIERWDKSCMSNLPDYMKPVYEAVLDTFQGFEQDLAKEGRSQLVSYVRELMKAQCKGYFQEAKLCHQKHVSTYDEYMEYLAILTSGYTLMSGATFLGMGEFAAKAAFEWVSKTPRPVKASCIITRLTGDIAAYKFERKRDHGATTVDCYMKQHGVAEEEAVKELQKLTEEAWKDLNEEMLRPTEFPRPLMNRILNLTRVIEIFYGFGEDDYSIVSQNMQDRIRLVLIDPVMV